MASTLWGDFNNEDSNNNSGKHNISYTPTSIKMTSERKMLANGRVAQAFSYRL
jgi:hypothetical protein